MENIGEYCKYKVTNFENKTALIQDYICLGEKYEGANGFKASNVLMSDYVKNLIAQLPEKNNEMEQYLSVKDLDISYVNRIPQQWNNSETKKRTYYFYARIESTVNTTALFCLQCSALAKWYINGRMIDEQRNMYFTPNYSTAEIRKGRNDFLMEVYEPDVGKDKFFNQIMNYQEQLSDDTTSLKHIGVENMINPVKCFCDDVSDIKDNILKFAVFTNRTDITEEFNYSINNNEPAIEYIKGKGKINTPLEVDISSIGWLRTLKQQDLKSVILMCFLKDKSGEEIKTGEFIFLTEMEQFAVPIFKRLSKYKDKFSLDINTQIDGLLNSYKNEKKNRINLYWWCCLCLQLIERIEKNIDDFDSYKGSTLHYIKSKLDGKIIPIYSYLPECYNKANNYPIFIFLSTWFVDAYPGSLPYDKLDEPVICVEATGRGVTAGSYLGEASIKEIVEWAKEKFSIDEDRMYLIGRSNGGYATWALAENYPGTWAGLFPLAGYPIMKEIKNLTNERIITIVSSQDNVFKNKENEIRNAIGKFGNYTQFNIDQMLHLHVMDMIKNDTILNNLLKVKRNKYPKDIYFKTSRNRHLLSYYISILGIKKGKKEAVISSSIDNDLVRIKCRNCNGIKITLPPYINKSRFTIIVNGKEFVLQNYKSDDVIISLKGTSKLINNEPNYDISVGTGLLDVYFDPLTIVIPQNCSDVISALADKFSLPNTNGINGELGVRYPICTKATYPLGAFQGSFVTINEDIECCGDKEVTYDDKGFDYNGQHYDGNYVVMEICRNRFYKKVSVLNIATNNIALLKKHILLRNVTMPIYFKGLHPYWNNQILIYYNGKYLAAYNKGEKLEEVK